MALHLFGYLKKYPNRQFLLNSDTPKMDPSLDTQAFHPDFLEDYPDAAEELDPGLPEAFGDELDTAIFFDADLAHDVKTRRSISGIVQFVGSTPVSWSSRRQGSIATSTYCSEFIAMRSAVEEAIALRYMLRCLGIPVTKPTMLFGDNQSSLKSAQRADGVLNKKRVAISYHFVREAVAAKIVNPVWVQSHENFADLFTKPLGKNIFQTLVSKMMLTRS